MRRGTDQGTTVGTRPLAVAWRLSCLLAVLAAVGCGSAPQRESTAAGASAPVVVVPQRDWSRRGALFRHPRSIRGWLRRQQPERRPQQSGRFPWRRLRRAHRAARRDREPRRHGDLDHADRAPDRLLPAVPAAHGRHGAGRLVRALRLPRLLGRRLPDHRPALRHRGGTEAAGRCGARARHQGAARRRLQPRRATTRNT